MIDILAQTGIPVIPVNLARVMGAGLAKQAKDRLPGLDNIYRHKISSGELRMGRPVVVPPEDDWPLHNNGVILFATKLHWEQPSEYGWIADGMRELRRKADLFGVVRHNHIWVPALGCGLGGLDERRVYAMYMEILGGLPNMHYVGADRVERWLGDQFRRGEST